MAQPESGISIMTKNRPEADHLLSRTANTNETAAPKGLPYLSIEKAILESNTILEKRLKKAPALIRPYSAYLTRSQGKGIRARALILSAMNDEGLVPSDAPVFAAAIELLHLATLVHDDVMDDADYRRGEETLKKRSGSRVAVITGDYLLADVLLMMAEAADLGDYPELTKPGFLTKYLMRIALGELRQTLLNGEYGIKITDYFRIISGKTAALFEAAFLAGSILHTKDEKERALYRKIGRYVGMIFQLTDDCMDYESTLIDAGKNVQSDFEQQVITLPLIYAMDEDPKLKQDIEQGLVDADAVYERVQSSQSLKRTRRVAKRYREKAVKAISQLSCSSEKKDKLLEIVTLSYREF